jgi:hypothetical protein
MNLINIFIGDVSPMNVDSYVYWCHITDEYMMLHTSMCLLVNR